MRHRIVIWAAVLVLSLASRPSRADNLNSGESVQLDALNANTALLLVGDSKLYSLYSLDLQSGKATLLKGTGFAVDRRSGTVLSAARGEGGNYLTLYQFKNNSLVPIAKGFVRLSLDELQSAKATDTPTFLFSGFVSAQKRAEGELPILVHQFITLSPDGTRLERSPVPGLSEISELMGVETIGFSGDRHGTFAYATLVSTQSLPAIKDAIKTPTEATRGCYFVVVSDGKAKYAWPVPFPSPNGGRVIGFSQDGRQLLAQINIGANPFNVHDSGYKLIDLATGAITSWPLGNPYEVLAIDSSLKRALIQSQYAIPAPGTPDDAPLQNAASDPDATQWRWRAELIEQGKPPIKLLQLDGGDVELAGTFIKGRFYVTDGQTLATIDDQNHVVSEPIVFEKK